MRAPELLHELESMTYGARVRRMVELGRRSRDDVHIAEVLDHLERGGFYEHLLALQSCFGSYDSARVLRAVSAPSRMLHALAVRLLPLTCDDGQVVATFDSMASAQRRALVNALRRRGRGAIIDMLLGALAARGDLELARLISFGTAAAVREHFDQVRGSMSDQDWRALAHAHPQLVADALQREAEAVTSPDPRLVWQVNAVLPELAETAPDRALWLVRALLRHVSLAELNLQRLGERRPADMADLLLGQEDHAQVNLSRRAHRLDTEHLIALVGRHSNVLPQSGDWFKRLLPAQRRAVYLAYRTGWRDDDGSMPAAIVALLPGDLREAEGRRNLMLPALATRPAQRLAYAAFVPWDEARATLDPALRSPDADLRSAALSALAMATRFYRDHVPDLLDILRARRNEQDPVRRGMLSGLADLPPGIWRTEHLDRLGDVLRAALDAADLSAGSAAAAERLIVALLPFHPGWSTGWLATFVRERGAISHWGLGERLTEEDVLRIAPALLPVLQSWQTREREQQLINVAGSLGRRLRQFDGLIELLERVIQTTRVAWIADQALRLIAEHRRDRLAVLVPELLGVTTGWAAPVTSRIPALRGGDPSWVTRPVVYTYLHHRRQDLLTPFLGQRAYSGRFSTGKTRFVLPLFGGFHRWTATQQATFATTLGELASEDGRETPTVLRSILQLAALPAMPLTRLIALARDDRVAVRDAALRALGRVDDVEHAVPVLIGALEDDRAPVAIYALRRSLLAMPAERALPLLRRASLERVTVAKEVVRLLGDLRSEEAYRELLSLETRDLHRDVRVALLRGLWSHPERDEPWEIFDRAARLADASFARSLVRIPAERLSAKAQRRLVRLLALLLEHPEPTVRVDVLRRCAELPVADTERLLLTPLLRAMGSTVRDEVDAAAGAVFQTYTGREASLVAEAVGRLVDNRRALWSVAQALRSALQRSHSKLLPTVRALLGVLAADPLTVNLQVNLAVQALPADELAALLTKLAATGHLHSDAVATAVASIQHTSSRVDAVDLASLEVALAASTDPVLRRCGLAALVAQARPPHGWDTARFDRLQAYRQDPSPLVAGAAQFTFPPDDVT